MKQAIILRTSSLIILAVFFSSKMMLPQCGFEAVPIAGSVWYLSAGWQMRGVNEKVPLPLQAYRDIVFRPVNVSVSGKQPSWPDGVTLSAMSHPFSANFPEAVFEENSKAQKMLARTVGVRLIYRWEIHGKAYAYSYMLIPRGVLCFFTAEFVDDKGDGVFRMMTQSGHVSLMQGPPPLPEWARNPKS